MITENNLKRLKREYTVAFERYVDLAQQTCEFINDIQKCPISVNERAGLILHRRREDTARDPYLTVRHKLMDAQSERPRLQCEDWPYLNAWR